MDLQLKGKLALISGSTAGIGYAIAESLAREGCRIIINGRTQKRVDAALAKLTAALGGTAGGPTAAVGVAEDLGTAQGVAETVARFPHVDILINNMGIFEPKAFEDIPDEDWLRFFEVNVLSGVRLSRRYLPGMKAAGWGRIIFISSESGVQIPAEMIHYGMTKTAQLAISRGLAETTAGTGVTVNAVLPGPKASRDSSTTWRRRGARIARPSNGSSSRTSGRLRCCAGLRHRRRWRPWLHLSPAHVRPQPTALRCGWMVELYGP
jgi:NAD(P)-dependent dehydrogenase (short-subunit alcohol dehydrogenase family)